ncbi:MAG: hypothetical protein ACR2P1_04850 [Pseudomonadales bacterium]
MTNSDEDDGTIAVVMERLHKYRLPRALDLKERVDRGELLSDIEIEFLKRVFADANTVMPIVDRHPEYQDLAARVIDLYYEITNKALENEKKP